MPPPNGPPAIEGGFVWSPIREIANGPGRDLLKIDPSGGVVARLPLGAFPYGVTVHDGHIYAAASDQKTRGGYVAKIDPVTHDLVECWRLGGPEGQFMAISGETLWVASWTDNTILRLNLVTGRIEARLPALEAHGIAAADDGVWSPRHHSGIVVRIDPATNETLEIDTGMRTTEYVALTSDAVWVTGGEGGGLVGLSRSDDSVLVKIPGNHFESIVARGEVVWALDVIDDPQSGAYGRIVEIDAASRTVRREYPLSGWRPFLHGADAAGEHLYVLTDIGYLVTVPVE